MRYHLAVITAALAALCLPVTAAVSGFTNGSIILGFNATSGLGQNSAVEVSLGLATDFRDATSHLLNLVNLGSILETTYGVNWFERTDLSFGLGTVWTNISPDVIPPLNGDPGRTLYLSKSRAPTGDEWRENSSITRAGVGTLQVASNSLFVFQNRFLQAGNGAVDAQGRGAASVLDEALTATFEEYTPATGVHFNFVSGTPNGITQTFGLGALGTYSTGDQEGALDLYRFQGRNNIAGQYGFGEPNYVGTFEGIFTIDRDGSVSFIAPVFTPIPEPSMLALGVAPLAALAVRRRRVVLAA